MNDCQEEPMFLMHVFMMLTTAMLFCSSASASDVFNVVFKPRNAGDIVFSHDVHTKSPKINDRCATCHEKIYKTKSKRPVTMAEMERGKSCGACHGRIAFPLSACGRCHTIREITFRVQPTGDVVFPHAPHTKKLQCGVCHPRLFKPGRNRHVTMAEMEEGKSCGACHTGQRAFALADCSRCHRAGNVLMKVTGAGPVTFSHAFHTNLYRCTDCHTKVFPLGYTRPRATMNDMDQHKSCGACHDDYTAFTVRENCVRCHDM
jgi:c(7)-type cytochrome triheme protein